jgi:hypothetical protein
MYHETEKPKHRIGSLAICVMVVLLFTGALGWFMHYDLTHGAPCACTCAPKP